MIPDYLGVREKKMGMETRLHRKSLGRGGSKNFKKKTEPTLATRQEIWKEESSEW